MSTKTTFKRVALVAVAALGLGVMTSVAPANARTAGVAVTLGTPTANVSVVGQATTITAPITLTTLAANDTFVVSAVLQAKPVGSTNAALKDMLRLHIFPTLAHRDIRTISRTDIQSTIHGLPPQTSAMALAVMKTVFREALAQEVIQTSPAHGVSGPKIMVNHENSLRGKKSLQVPSVSTPRTLSF
jgi:hypothetical protein